TRNTFRVGGGREGVAFGGTRERCAAAGEAGAADALRTKRRRDATKPLGRDEDAPLARRSRSRGPDLATGRRTIVRYFVDASSSSMTSLNFSNGWAPTSMRPFTKKAGV